MTPSELYTIFQQSGALSSQGKGSSFVRALTTGRLPADEVRKFATGQPSAVDTLISGDASTLDEIDLSEVEVDIPLGQQAASATDEAASPALPVVSAKAALAALDRMVTAVADEEAVDFLIASATDKLWRTAFDNEERAEGEAREFSGSAYTERVAESFLDELVAVRSFPLPEGYAFRPNGSTNGPVPPNLMQRLVAWRVAQRRRVGNWSGTGAGKTLSAVLASRLCGAELTVVCCPNSVVDIWHSAIHGAFPASQVLTKTFSPSWMGDGRPRYLVLNYEAFQQPDSEVRLRGLLAQHRVDFVVIDEIHFAKQRNAKEESLRRQRVTALLAHAAADNHELHVLAMSATPVINDLHEGRSMVELVTGLVHHDVETRPTVPNAIALHQRLVALGTRWRPDYSKEHRLEEVQVHVDCSQRLDEIRRLGKRDLLGLEQILTEVRLSTIVENVRPKTLIYTHYVEGIDRMLHRALSAAGWRVGFFTGDDHTGLDHFIDGDLDVLIGSSAVGTGVDGLQKVCSTLIFAVLPWTHAEYEQIIGRVYRQGQRAGSVRVVIPVTYAEMGSERWSWCEAKLQRIAFKRSLADAAVDGVVPEGHLRTPQQAYQDVMSWLTRLDEGNLATVTRRPLLVLLNEATVVEQAKRRGAYSDFSGLNNRWNRSHSQQTHRRLSEHPEEWAEYHAQYREARKGWPVVPFEDFLRWAEARTGYTIGDFGCGEALVSKALAGRHTVHSFDHVAIDGTVVACDMSRTPLEDRALDVALFSLSLMGSNVTDYLFEAWRVLKLDGHLHIYEATSRFGEESGREAFVDGLGRLGFDIVRVEDRSKFTYVHAIKSGRQPLPDVVVAFREP